MTTDIVERLRNRIHDAPMPTERMLDEAADEIEMLWNAVAEKNAEIERLRGAVETCRELRKLDADQIERLHDANEGYQVLVRSLTAEIDRLRSALDKIYRITLAVNALKREPAA